MKVVTRQVNKKKVDWSKTQLVISSNNNIIVLTRGSRDDYWFSGMVVSCREGDGDYSHYQVGDFNEEFSKDDFLKYDGSVELISE